MSSAEERSTSTVDVAVDFGGAGLWVWNADESDPAQLAKLLARNGFQYMAVKAHDGTKPFNRNEPHLPTYSHACRRHGLAFGIWGYLKAEDAAGEARFAAELVRRHRAAFYIADAEGEYEVAPGRVSREFAAEFRRELPTLPAALSSFGRIDFHPDLDWQAWRDQGFEFHPQAYECDNHLLTPARCVAAARRIWPLSMIRPTLGAYKGAVSRPTPRRLAQSLEEAPTRGFNVWRNGTATARDFRALAGKHDTDTTVAAAVHRPLRLEPVLLTGPDVKELQVAVNRALDPPHLGRIDEDGDFGPQTHAAAFEAAWFLGITNTRSAAVLSVYIQKRIREPALRNRTQLARAEKRRRELADHKVVAPVATPPGSRSEFAIRDAEGAPDRNGVRYHAAKDWFAPGGSRVGAPVAGKVVEVRLSKGNTGQVFGGVVKIQAASDRTIWVFRHVEPKVDLGDLVGAGDRIASVTAWRDGPSHTHIEVWKTLVGGYRYENMIDPMRFFR